MEPLEAVVRRHTLRVLNACGGNKTRAADALEVSLKTVYNWLNRWELAGLVECVGGEWHEVHTEGGGNG